MTEPIDLAEIRHDWLKVLLRHAAPILTPTEFRVVMFIYERTLLWDKVDDFISTGQIANGVYAQHRLVTGGTGLSDATIYRTIDTLEKKGLLIREKNGPGRQARFTFNFSWNLIEYVSITLAENPEFKHDFGEGMQLFVGPGDGDLLSSMRDVTLTSERTNSHPREIQREIIQKEIKTGCAGTRARTPTQGLLETVTKDDPMANAAVEALRSKLQQTTAATNEKREVRKRRLNATALQKIWEDAFKKAHPTEKFFAWRVRELGAFKKAVHQHIELSEAKDFIEWAVANFANVIGQRLRWMKTPPRLPDVNTVISQISVFWLAFEDARDPNRVLRDRMSKDANEAPAFKVKPLPTVSAAKAKALETENKQLREKLRVVGKQEIERRAASTREARALVKNRSTKSDEFGSWDDQG